jgi:peroxiredoxin
MNTNSERETLDDAFRRVRDLDVSLREQLRTFSETVRRDRPEFAAAVDRLITRLRQYGAGESAPQIGEPMPPFVLPDETGQMVSLDELLNRGPVAVTFHRGHWCPYCRININALVQAHKELAVDEGEIVAIIPDRQKFAADLKLQSDVPFPILTDADNGYALSLNLTIWVGAEIKNMMEGRLDLPNFQGNSSWMLPIPAIFVVGRDGLIRSRFIDPDYRKRMMIADMMAAMKLTN